MNRSGRDASPTAAIIDSRHEDHRGWLGHAVTTPERRSTDVNAMVLVDKDGRGLVLESYPASIQDRDKRRTASANLAMHLPVHPAGLRRQRIRRGNSHDGNVDRGRDRAQDRRSGWFAVNPRRWVVERFFAWIGREIHGWQATPRRPSNSARASSTPHPSCAARVSVRSRFMTFETHSKGRRRG